MKRFYCWTAIRRDLQILRSAPPGRRFRDFRRFKSQQIRNWSLFSKILSGGSGVLLVLVGLGIGWLPGPGGFLAILGLAVLIPFIPGMASVMDRIEIWLRKMTKALLA